MPAAAATASAAPLSNKIREPPWRADASVANAPGTHVCKLAIVEGVCRPCFDITKGGRSVYDESDQEVCSKNSDGCSAHVNIVL